MRKFYRSAPGKPRGHVWGRLNALCVLLTSLALSASVIGAPNDGSVEIVDSNVQSIKVGRTVPKNTPLKLSATEWVKYSDRASGKRETCVGKYEGPLSNCPAPKPCGLLSLMSDECGKNGVALP